MVDSSYIAKLSVSVARFRAISTIIYEIPSYAHDYAPATDVTRDSIRAPALYASTNLIASRAAAIFATELA